MNNDRQIVEAFERNFRDYGDLGASVSVWKDGKEIVSLHSGFAVADETRPWTEHSLVPVYSATKGASSAAALRIHRADDVPPVRPSGLFPDGQRV